MNDLNARFARDYADARAKFLAAVSLAGGAHRAYVNPNKGPEGESLTTDVAWFGPRDAKAVLVTTSSMHGVEGFCGSGAQVDFILGPGPGALPPGVALLMAHAINPHGFAWLRRVTEEGCDLNRNFGDFSKPMPENPGYDELADAFLPVDLAPATLEAAEAKIKAYRAKNGERQYAIARSGGQYKHRHGMFFGGTGPTWARRTLEQIVKDYDLRGRARVAVIDYHTGLGPHGYGEPICCNDPGTPGHASCKAWYGDSLTEPSLGTSSSVPKVGTEEEFWERELQGRAVAIALEYGTYHSDNVRATMRADHWLHAHTNVDWHAAEVQRVKKALKKHFYPEMPDWQEAVLWRSGQIMRQALNGLAAD